MAIIADRLKAGDEVRVVAPSRSLSQPFITPIIPLAEQRLSELGFKLTYGKHAKETDEFGSTTVEHRVEDLHDAFSDKNVKLVITAIGGFNTNQMLKYLDYNLIKGNPKAFCGYSDITALQNAIFARTGLVTYSGPHFFSFGAQEDYQYQYTLDYFRRCLFSSERFSISPSEHIMEWASRASKTISYENEGNWVLRPGNAEGTIVGANLCTFNLLQGTEFMPSLDGSVLFVEDDDATNPVTLDRDLQSLLHQPGADGIKGLVVGRFQKESEMTMALLKRIAESKKELEGLPIVANVDFGHTYPMITYPIGGRCGLATRGKKAEISILEH